MDKKTISHYGWVVVISLVMAVMLALATPFGTYIGDGIVSIAQGMVGTNSEAVKDENVENLKDKFSDILNDCPHENTHITGVKETTCGKDGYTGDLVCKDCLAVLKEGEKTKGTIHDYGTQVVKTPSTCSEQGIAEKTCKNCGHIEKVYLETVAHSNFYETGGKAATCTVDGNTPNRLCGVCNTVVEYGQTIKSTGHTVVKTNAVAATCSATGLTEGSHCSKCNEVIKKQTVIPKAAHAEINGGTAGIHKKCKVCGITTDTIHSYSMTTLGTATCTEGAIIRNQCNCGYYYDTQMPAKPHTEVAVAAVTATCTQKGLSAGTKCSVCNTWIVPQYESSLNPNNHTGSIVNAGTKEIHTKYNCCNKTVSTAHSYTEVVTLAATCTTDGTKSHQCSCGYSYTTTIAKTGHTIVTLSATTATCKTPGLTSGTKCSTCNTIIDQQVASALNPNNHEGSIVNGGTANVHTKYSCCNKTVSTTHSYTTTTTTASCTSGGKKVDTCNCGYKIETTTPATGHDVTPVTLGTSYTSHYECENCDAMIIPEGATYYINSDYKNTGDYETADEVIIGDGLTTEFPEPNTHDIYQYKDYEYYYGYSYCDDYVWSTRCGCYDEATDWAVRYNGKDSTPVEILPYIGGCPITSTRWTFASNTAVEYAPLIPETVDDVVGMFSYCINLDTYVGSEYHEDFENYPIPENIESMDNMFEHCEMIRSTPIFPSNIKTLNYAFEQCVNLQYVTPIPDTITSLEGTFIGCVELTHAPEISHCKNLKNLRGTFMSCTAITMFPDLPNNIEEMDYAFASCTSITENSDYDTYITGYIPNKVTSLLYTFSDCDNLYYMEIPEQVTNMYGTFADCDSISEIYVPKNVTCIDYMAVDCDSLWYVGFTDKNQSLTSMAYAFNNCPRLSEVYGTIPSTVKNMEFAFAYTSLSYDYMGYAIKIDANPTDYTKCFYGCPNLAYIDGKSDMLYELAGTDGYYNRSANDKIRDVRENTIPNGAIFYDQPTDKLGDYGDSQYIVGDGVETVISSQDLKQGVALVYNGYEYRYQMTINVFKSTDEVDGFYNYWQNWAVGNTPASALDGWGVSILDRNVTAVYYPVLEEIAGEPITGMCSTFEDCHNLTTLPSNFTIPSGVVSTFQMFDECYSLEKLPETFILPDSILNTSGMFWENHSLTKLPKNFTIPSSLNWMDNMFSECACLEGIITINANPEVYTDCFTDTVYDIYLTGSSTILGEIATQDTEDNVHVLDLKGVIPTGGVYYRGIPVYEAGGTHSNGNYVGSYSKATTTYTAGNTFPTPQTGDRFVYDGYEYAYNCYADNNFYGNGDYTNFAWIKDESLNGWGVRVLDTTQSHYAMPMTSIVGYPITSYASLYEDCFDFYGWNNTAFVPNTIKTMRQMFDQCEIMTSVPDSFTIPDSVINASGIFYDCYALEYIPDTFTIGKNVTDIGDLFNGCGVVSGDVIINSNKLENWNNAFNATYYDIYLSGACEYSTLREIAEQYSNVYVRTYKNIESEHGTYAHNQDHIVLGTWNFENAESVDIYLTYETESTTLDYFYITEGVDFISGVSMNETRNYLTKYGDVISTTINDTNYNSEIRFGGTNSLVFEDVDLTTGSVVFRTDGSVNSFDGVYVTIVPHYKVTIESAHPYANNQNFVKLGDWEFENTSTVDIKITCTSERILYDYITITSGMDYTDGTSQTETRQYLTTAGSLISTVGTSDTSDIRFGTTSSGETITYTFEDVPMTQASVILKTDSSVVYDGFKIEVISNG